MFVYALCHINIGTFYLLDREVEIPEHMFYKKKLQLEVPRFGVIICGAHEI